MRYRKEIISQTPKTEIYIPDQARQLSSSSLSSSFFHSLCAYAEYRMNLIADFQTFQNSSLRHQSQSAFTQHPASHQQHQAKSQIQVPSQPNLGIRLPVPSIIKFQINPFSQHIYHARNLRLTRLQSPFQASSFLLEAKRSNRQGRSQTHTEVTHRHLPKSAFLFQLAFSDLLHLHHWIGSSWKEGRCRVSCEGRGFMHVMMEDEWLGMSVGGEAEKD